MLFFSLVFCFRLLASFPSPKTTTTHTYTHNKQQPKNNNQNIISAAVDDALASGAALDEDGIEEAFELVAEVPERVRTGLWVGDCFVYNNAAWRLNYVVGGEVRLVCL